MPCAVRKRVSGVSRQGAGSFRLFQVCSADHVFDLNLRKIQSANGKDAALNRASDIEMTAPARRDKRVVCNSVERAQILRGVEILQPRLSNGVNSIGRAGVISVNLEVASIRHGKELAGFDALL